MGDGFGLCTADGSAQVPLEGVRVTGDILGRGARVKVAQRFANREARAIEAVYRFPLPESAAVCGFSALVDGRRVSGGVEERDKAFERYDDALAAGDGAYLLDQERPNVFTLSVGNLVPGAAAVVEIEYVELLDQRGLEVRFALPTTIAPRYLPADAPDEEGMRASDRIHPEYAAAVPYGLSLEVTVRDPGGVESVESPSHPVRVASGAGGIVVSLSAETAAMDRDFVMNIAHRGAAEGRAWRYADARGAWVQLDLSPAEADANDAAAGTGTAGVVPSPAPREVVFLLDCSGSMQGDSIAQAKRALEVCLKALEPGSSFNVVRFGSSFQSLFDRPRDYGERSLGEALGWLQAVDADLGGTEVLAPLSHVYRATVPEGAARSVVLLTDGEVGNEAQVMSLVRSGAGTTRFFCVGIGAGPNDHLVKGLARAGGGAAAFIFPGERIEPRVLAIFRQAVGPRVTAIRVEWGTVSGGAPATTPAVPVLLPGEATSVFARLGPGAEPPAAVTVLAEIDGRPARWQLPVVEAGAGAVALPPLWARSRIRDLEESHEAAGRGSRQGRPKGDAWKAEVVALAKEFGLSSSLTSWIAVEERTDKQTGEIVLRKVPSLVTAGWHGRGSVLGAQVAKSAYGNVGMQKLAAPCMATAAPATMAFSRQKLFETRPGEVMEYSPMSRADVSFDDGQADTDLLVDLLALQRVDGGFDLDKQMLARLGIDHAAANAVVALIPAPRALAVRALHTAIVLAVLEARFADERGTWFAAVRKSRAWLNRVAGSWGPALDAKAFENLVKDIVPLPKPMSAQGGL